MRALIVLTGLLLLLPLDASPGGRPDAPDKLVVVDVNGKQVGTVVGSRVNRVTIALSVNGRQALLEVASAVDTPVFPGAVLFLVPPIRGAGGVSFESRDCSGPPFLFQFGYRLLDVGFIAPPGMTLYLPTVPGAGAKRIAWSSSWEYGGCRTQDPPVSSDAYVPAVAIVDLLTLFTPPFRLLIVD
ncbi:MAG TPA: hypothetical protein VK548_22240 [Candidatus Acidoferrum sp.]|nr:hypothetical protein [Candidatus Acidoferrum sp.]